MACEDVQVDGVRPTGRGLNKRSDEIESGAGNVGRGRTSGRANETSTCGQEVSEVSLVLRTGENAARNVENGWWSKRDVDVCGQEASGVSLVLRTGESAARERPEVWQDERDA